MLTLRHQFISFQMVNGATRLKKAKSKAIKENRLQYILYKHANIYAVIPNRVSMALCMPFAILSVAARLGINTDVNFTVCSGS